jgi:hypothetical protein
MIYEFSDIDNEPPERKVVRTEIFLHFWTSPQNGIRATMLCQNHEKVIKGFMGQTTAFKKESVETGCPRDG